MKENLSKGEYLFLLILISFSVTRYAPNLFDANFYAEDGSIFTKNFLEHGLPALFEPFNGYPVFGLYVLVGLAFLLKLILFLQGYELPAVLAFISFCFWGFVAWSPTIFLRNFLSRTNRTLLSLSLVFIPLGSYDYAVLGTIGNLKFSFLPLSIFIAMYISSTENTLSGRTTTAYILFLVCLLTNPLAWLSIPILVKRFRSLYIQNKVKAIALIAPLASVLIYQSIVFVFDKTELVGYLDKPFEKSKVVEVFLGQSILYSPFHAIYSNLNDASAFILFLVLLLFIAPTFSATSFMSIYLLSVALLTTLVFVMQRPGVSEYFFGYTLSSPSQFFYAQNMLIMTSLFLAVEVYSRKRLFMIKKLGRSLPFVLLIFQISPNQPIGTFGKIATMQSQVDSASQSYKRLCVGNRSNKHEVLSIPIYPSEPWVFITSSDFWCH